MEVEIRLSSRRVAHPNGRHVAIGKRHPIDWDRSGQKANSQANAANAAVVGHPWLLGAHRSRRYRCNRMDNGAICKPDRAFGAPLRSPELTLMSIDGESDADHYDTLAGA
jgi:hypothetical protein